MDEQIDRLVDKVWGKSYVRYDISGRADNIEGQYKDASASKRLLIAVSGIPGSGRQALTHVQEPDGKAYSQQAKRH